MKVDAKIFKGIEYVQLNELPQAQRELLTQTINPDLFIKLLVDGKIISGCLQYKDYNNWYQNHFQQKLSTAREESSRPDIEIQPNLALNKI
jgi:hypothetical protein